MAFRVRSLVHLNERIIPFFQKHSLKSKKNIDFKKFRTIVLLMERQEHLKAEGISKIREIASSMNKG